jgi:hypothetical protein
VFIADIEYPLNLPARVTGRNDFVLLIDSESLRSIFSPMRHKRLVQGSIHRYPLYLSAALAVTGEVLLPLNAVQI